LVVRDVVVRGGIEPPT